VLIANDRTLRPVQSARQRIGFAREVFVATNNLLENLTEILFILNKTFKKKNFLYK
jgi:hypothetical protein